MTGFPAHLSSPQYTTLRTSGYWAAVFACLNPNTVIFRARASQSITSAPFITFTWDSADVGAYTDVWEGMIVYISSTTSIRDAKYRGRVRLAPSASQFFISRNATVLNDNDYIIVVRDTDLFVRERNDTLIDDSIPYHDLPPMLKDHPHTIVLYDQNNDGSEDYTPVQVGLAVDVNATAVDTWQWDVSGDGAFTIDDPTLEHPAFTFEAGYHYLLRVRYTDDNDQTNYQISHVYCVTRTFGAPVVPALVTSSGGGSVEEGYTASVTAYADVETLIDRTHCAVWMFQHFGDESTTPMVSNVLMNGRIRSDSIQTEGSTESGQLQQVTFTVEGITAYLRHLRTPNDIVRASATPDEWGEITEPNPYRMAVYAMWAYTTLTNLCSFGVEDGAFAAWQIGAEPRALEGGFAYDMLTTLLWDTIKAAPNHAPTGEIYLARTVSYLEDRSGVPLVATMTLNDITLYSVNRDSSDTVSQVIAFGGSFNITTNSFVLYTSQSPSIVYREGEVQEITREVLVANSTTDEARTELGLRSSNHYAYENSKSLLKETVYDAWVGVLIPTNFQRWSDVLPASSNTLGVAYTATDYWQLQSVNWTVNDDGSMTVSIEKVQETSFDDAQIKASLLPINLETVNPVLPVLPNDPLFPTDPIELYPTDTPNDMDLQPIDPFSGMGAYSPFPPDVAAEIAANQGTAGCKTLRVNFKSSDNTISSWTTVLSDDYLMTLSGKATISGGNPNCADLTASDEGWTPVSAFGNDYAVYHSGEGYGRSATILGRIIIHKSLAPFAGATLQITFNEPFTGYLYLSPFVYVYTGVGLSYYTAVTSISLPGVTYTDGLSIDIGVDENDPTTPLSATLRMEMVCIPGAGSGSAVTTEVDAFYKGEPDEEGIWQNVSLLDDGLYLDNSKYTEIPPYNESHRYEGLPFIGTNNPLYARMVFDDYTENQDVYLFLEMCRQ